MKESEIENQVCKYASKAGWYVRKFSSPGHRGVPDRVLLSPTGLIIFIEFKAPSKKPSALQVDEIAQIRKRGGIVYIVDNVEEGKKIIDSS